MYNEKTALPFWTSNHISQVLTGSNIRQSLSGSPDGQRVRKSRDHLTGVRSSTSDATLSDYIYDKPVLRTDRLVLRTLRPDDVPALREWMPDKSMYKYWGKNAGKADKEPSLLFVHPEKPGKSFHWGIEFEGKVVGEIWIYLIEGDRMAKLAFRVAPAAQGKGIATEAVKAVLKFCFEKTGFLREGLIRQGKMVSTWCDYYIYGILW